VPLLTPSKIKYSMAKQRTPAEIELERLKEENRHSRFIQIVDSITRLSLVGIQWAGLVGIMYFTYNSVSVLSGKATFADIGIRLIGDLKISEGLAYCLGSGGILYGLNQRRLRRQTIEHLSSRLRRYESQIDPNRTSSGLTPKGTTPPEG
jgi:hypothetical protein